MKVKITIYLGKDETVYIVPAFLIRTAMSEILGELVVMPDKIVIEKIDEN